MSELKITEAQLEAARVAYVKARDGDNGTITDGLRAAAPFLQFELEPVSVEEIESIWRNDRHWGGNTVINDIAARLLFNDIIERRKAALLPEPVDPRREIHRAVEFLTAIDTAQRSIPEALAALRNADAALGKTARAEEAGGTR